MYHFDVQNGVFIKALEVFAEFFHSPLLCKSAIQKEINAVHSEFLKNQNNDSWKSFHLFKTLCNKDSPFKKFGTGNMDSLSGSDLHQKVRKFYEDHYR